MQARARSPLWVLALTLAMAGCDPLSLASSLFDDGPRGTSILMLLDTDGREIEIGDEVTGSLSSSDWVGLNDAYLEAWEFEGQPGQKVWIDLTSSDFDSYLYVVGPGLADMLRDDDSGGACHARLEFTVLEKGDYRVVVSSSGSRSSGTYSLRVSDTPGPTAGVSCGGIDVGALAAIPGEGREIRRGVPATGWMTGGEPSIESGRPVQVWSLRGVEGERVTIRLESDAYDSYLYFAGPGMAEALVNDDGGSGLNSELTVTFARTGTYLIGASSLSSSANGQYTLSVIDPVDPYDLPTEGRRLQVGDDAQGTLTDTDPVVEGRPSQAWSFQATAGSRVTIELISDDFDSYLRVVGPGLGEGLTDDDSAGDFDSRLSVSFPQDGTYRVIASAFGSGTGSYRLIVRR